MDLTPQSLTDRARELYNACQTPKPSWDQIGAYTQDVWRQRVLEGRLVSDYAGPFA